MRTRVPRAASLLTALLLLVACVGAPEPAIEPEPSEPSLTELAQQSRLQNPDTAGWLCLPDTGIDDPVVHTPGELNSTNKYLTHNFEGEPDGRGCYFADGRARFGAGGRYELVCLTTIYGRSGSDDPESGFFAGIKHYRDEQFAREHPYLYFSTTLEEMVFEVVAVFEAHINLPYNRPDLAPGQYEWMLEAVRDSSLYRYDTGFDAADRLLVLSTNAMQVQGHAELDPAFSEYRFAVMGKLIPADEPLKEHADFTVNPLPAPPDAYNHTDWMGK